MNNETIQNLIKMMQEDGGMGGMGGLPTKDNNKMQQLIQKMNDPMFKYESSIEKITPKEVDDMFGDIEIVKLGGELLYIAICNQRSDIIGHLVSRGANLQLEPDSISSDRNYRKTPLIITAALQGDVDTF